MVLLSMSLWSTIVFFYRALGALMDFFLVICKTELNSKDLDLMCMWMIHFVWKCGHWANLEVWSS